MEGCDDERVVVDVEVTAVDEDVEVVVIVVVADNGDDDDANEEGRAVEAAEDR